MKKISYTKQLLDDEATIKALLRHLLARTDYRPETRLEAAKMLREMNRG